MRKGLVKITTQLMLESLGFPKHWNIEDMHTIIEGGHRVIECLISGPEFPRVPEEECAAFKRCVIIPQKETIRLEVKVID